MSDLSWWTEDNNDFVMQYLDNQLREAIKTRRFRTAAVHCSRCRATVVEVIALKLPDPAATPLHAIRFRKFRGLPADVEVADDAPPGEYGRAMAEAIGIRNAKTPSYRLGDWDWTCVIDGLDAAGSLITVAHECKNPEGKSFPDERLLSTGKILDGKIATIDPWPAD
jgi:hypothetical protein